MNQPFILRYIDYFKPEESIKEYTEYSSALSLNVLKGTETPATCVLSLEGETFTKHIKTLLIYVLMQKQVSLSFWKAEL